MAYSHTHACPPMYKAILMRATDPPTARAAAPLPPTAKIQLPARVRSNNQVASTDKTIQYRTLTLRAKPPILMYDANTACADAKPGIELISPVATPPVISRVRAMLMPCNMRKVDKV